LSGPTTKAEEGKERRGKERGKWRERRGESIGKGRKGKETVGLLSTKNDNADIPQPEQIFKSSTKIVRFPKFSLCIEKKIRLRGLITMYFLFI